MAATPPTKSPARGKAQLAAARSPSTAPTGSRVMKPKARRRSRHQLRGAGIGFGAVSSGIAGELIGQLQYRPKEVVRRATGAGDDGNVALRQEILISKPAGSGDRAPRRQRE